jgi:hypothetical protein
MRQIVSGCGVESDVGILALVVATVAAATAPVATTGPAEQVTTSSARVSGTVNPGGATTTYHVEYGTTTAYGLFTRPRDAGAGSEPVSVHATLPALTADTEYHYRIVAENGVGSSAGDDATLRTAAKLRPPGAATGVARPVGATSTSLHGTVDPNGAPTGYHFEYGTTLAYGQSTPSVSAGASDILVRVTVPIAGLRPSTRYHVRLVATNAAGRTVAADRPFTTLRQPTGVNIDVAPARPVWGTAVRVTGMVTGDGIDHIPVALERLDFPFTSGFAQVGPPAKTDGSGRFKFVLPAVSSTTRVRVSTRTRVPAASPPVTVPVALKVGLRNRRLPHRRVQLSGAVWPATPHGRALLQRQGRRGRWIPVARRHLTPLPLDRSRFRFRLRLRRHARSYRVVVLARDGGAHVLGRSRTRRLPPLAR